MNRARTYFDPSRMSKPPAVSHMSAVEVNQLMIRIHCLKSIPPGARLIAFFACMEELRNVAPRFAPLLVGELQAACATLPAVQADRALKALATNSPGSFR
ncbi:MAG: hypothetical protein ABWY05_14150 [Noviherbaspirillum sp.]